MLPTNDGVGSVENKEWNHPENGIKLLLFGIFYRPPKTPAVNHISDGNIPFKEQIETKKGQSLGETGGASTGGGSGNIDLGGCK